MEKITVSNVTLTAPAHWASALINHDFSGLEEGELASLSAFLRREGVYINDCLGCEGEFFAWRHDASPEMPVGSVCSEYTFRKYE